jgi:hypothetical protein
MGSFVIIINPVYRTIETSSWYMKCAGTYKEPKEKKEPETPAVQKDAEN